MSIELDMFLLLKQAENFKYQKELDEEIEDVEKKYFGSIFEKVLQILEGNSLENNVDLERILLKYNIKFSSGSWRIGVFLEDDFVMKISLGSAGKKMNQRESNLLLDIYPKVYKHNPDYTWIIVEFAEDVNADFLDEFFPEINNLGLVRYFDFMDMPYTEAKYYDLLYMWHEVHNVVPGPHLQRFVDFLKTYPQATYDMVLHNLGVVMRNGKEFPVLRDAGIHGDINSRAGGVRRKFRQKVDQLRKEFGRLY